MWSAGAARGLEDLHHVGDDLVRLLLEGCQLAVGSAGMIGS
jgi:hypothetical protein